ncbi:MAG: NADH-quinone oxidoreductase subunit M [Planctomycetes bacterium]|nr:NADH-quinone oxidoreductase subunit M [Planctomycetota bacterium]
MLITLSTFIPLAAAVLVALLPGQARRTIKAVSLVATLAAFLCATLILRDYYAGRGETLAEASRARVEVLLNEAVGVTGEAGPTVEQRERREWLRSLVERPAGPEGAGGLAADESARLAEFKAADSYRLAREAFLASTVEQARHLRFTEWAPWIAQFGIHYLMAVDGLSLPLVWLTALLSVLCVVYSFGVTKVNETGTKGYYSLFLLLETGLIGVFCALDFFLFYVFWEIVLLPMYFLIGVWGGPRRIYAAIKFFIYTLVGSVLMLLAMLAFYFAVEPHSFNVIALMAVAPHFPRDFHKWAFLALFFAFAIKVPIFPFHTWLPDAHVEAPTAVSAVLAGILLKMGGYGFFRFSWPLCPVAALSDTWIGVFVVLGLVNLIYGALVAMAQTDFKKLVAYSSVSHMGYVLLGLAAMTPAGVNGAALQMFNHGVSSAMLFFVVGIIYDERAHHRDLNDFGGIFQQMPYYTGIAIVGFFASLGLPGLNGFISEVLVFLGAYEARTYGHWVVFVGVTGVVLTAAYILWAVQRVYLGPLQDKYRGFADIRWHESVTLVPLAFLCVLVGVWPDSVLRGMRASLESMISMTWPFFGS